MISDLRVIYEDNHLIAVNKLPGELVQGDETGDRTLADDVKAYLKTKYGKPGNVFLGIPHRLDRPTSGIVVYAKTDKALSRMTALFRTSAVRKTYWAIVDRKPAKDEATLVHYIVRSASNNKSIASSKERPGSKIAKLTYRVLASSDNYHLLEIDLHTGRHHQIRAQLAAIGVHIKGDLKYGAARSNPDGGICLHARHVSFVHPVKDIPVDIIADPPHDTLWDYFLRAAESEHI